MKHIVVLTGAGISAESGIKTFRDMGGLWQEYDITEVASPNAWVENRQMVLEFYNIRRKQLLETEPNAGHKALVDLAKKYKVDIITQNVDDLHERAGSKNILHLHGEIRKARSTTDPSLIYDIDGWELKEGDVCEKGSQLRPHVVWFGESVPNIVPASRLAGKADVFLVIGTSLSVYPAAGLIDFVPRTSKKIIIDPNARPMTGEPNIETINEKASVGVPKIVERLLNEPS